MYSLLPGHCFLKYINKGRTVFVILIHLMCITQKGRTFCDNLLLMVVSQEDMLYTYRHFI